MIQRISMIIILVIASMLFVTNDVTAQSFSDLDNSPADIASFPKRGGDKVVKVVYSRPQSKGRKVFGELVNYDKVWRTGANEATEITFYKDVKIAGKVVKVGTYTVFTIPIEEGKWTLILNSDLNQWGAYQYKESADVMRVQVSTKKSKETIEVFSITFGKAKNGAMMYLGWENTVVEIPIEF
jgi:hypothetical protein